MPALRTARRGDLVCELRVEVPTELSDEEAELLARFAALRNYDAVSTTPSSAFSTAVKNVVVYGTPSPANNATPVVPGLTTNKVTLTVDFSLGVPTGMTVAITGYQINGLFRKVTLDNKPKVRYSFQALWNPVAGGL